MAEIGISEYARRWRELNEDAVAKRNEASRMAEIRTSTCVTCGSEFERHASDRRQWCSLECQVERPEAAEEEA